jgi:hypothetical protein
MGDTLLRVSRPRVITASCHSGMCIQMTRYVKIG